MRSWSGSPWSPTYSPRAQGLTALREADPDFALLAAPPPCERVGDGRADYSAEHGRHGVNVQIATAPGGRPRWLSPLHCRAVPTT